MRTRSDDRMTIFGREYEDSAFGAARFQYDLMNPFDFDAQWTALRFAYGSGIAFGGYGLAALVSGTPMPSMAVQSINRAFMTGQRWRNLASLGTRVIPAVSVAAVPAVLAGGYAYQYEKHVNVSIRKGRSGFDINWFGPLGGSGFGSAV